MILSLSSTQGVKTGIDDCWPAKLIFLLLGRQTEKLFGWKMTRLALCHDLTVPNGSIVLDIFLKETGFLILFRSSWMAGYRVPSWCNCHSSWITKSNPSSLILAHVPSQCDKSFPAIITNKQRDANNFFFLLVTEKQSGSSPRF